jgi:DNA (cytosine-5)-methyltransferase 1
MENVKGLLSSAVGGNLVVHQILKDLNSPAAAATGVAGKRDHKYKIYSLVSDTSFDGSAEPSTIDLSSFVIRSEEYGVAQRRHRIILLGIRDDYDPGQVPKLIPQVVPQSVKEAIGDLPFIRSRLSSKDTDANWVAAVSRQSLRVRRAVRQLPEGAEDLDALLESNVPSLSDVTDPKQKNDGRKMSDWAAQLSDQRLSKVLNHKAKSHMEDDLGRYLFVSAFGAHFKMTPKTRHFPDLLAADHASWGSGSFADRFRVQLPHEPATTITSHIAKDGHYYIHYDLRQCRSLTVREAARLQTFPDNYFFEGNKTSQFTQVGNAVPPMLASQIARTVYNLLK